MNRTADDWDLILKKANEDSWVESVPTGSMKLKICVNGLSRHNRSIWNMTGEDLKQELGKNEEYQKILNTVSDSSIAFAIRQARFASSN